VRQFYKQLLTALPDLEIEVRQQHVAHEAILVEVMIRGTHLGGWRGLPATGRRVELPLCGIYTFNADDRLVGEKIYYDRGTVLRQLGVFHEPVSGMGRICTLAIHPLRSLRLTPENSSPSEVPKHSKQTASVRANCNMAKIAGAWHRSENSRCSSSRNREHRRQDCLD
jgi:SnoaL-like polyketide cyclase